MIAIFTSTMACPGGYCLPSSYSRTSYMDTLGTPLAFPLLADTTVSINAMHVWSLLFFQGGHNRVSAGGQEGRKTKGEAVKIRGGGEHAARETSETGQLRRYRSQLVILRRYNAHPLVLGGVVSLEEGV